MSSEFVILRCVESSDSDSESATTISTSDIETWDLTSLLHQDNLKIKADTNRLIHHSSYFRSLLTGNFSESSCNEITIYWNVESFLSVLSFMFGCPRDITHHNFLLLHQAGLFFGVDTLLEKCETWLSEVTLSSGVHKRQLDLTSLIGIWSYGIEHDNEVISQLCTSYLARNFMWVIACYSFGHIPEKLLYSCITHPDLTIESERALCDAILVWVAANINPAKDFSSFGNGATDMLKEIRSSLLPLWFIAGKRKCCLFSHYAEKGKHSILSLLRSPSMSNDVFGDSDLSHLKIRLTQYTEKLDLANCPQIKEEILLLAVIPYSSWSDPMRKLIKQCLDHLPVNKFHISRKLSEKSLTFNSLQEVDISNCPMMHLDAAIEYFGKSFPSLRSLKAAYFLNFETAKLHQLALRCPLLREVDLTLDISPVTSAQATIVSTSPSFRPTNPISLAGCESDSSMPILYYKARFQNLTKLTLEGRTDIIDSDLHSISNICPSLTYLNLKGCVCITDAAMSVMIAKCMKLHSLLACYTSFSQSSVQSLCSSPYNINKNLELETGSNFYSLANKLQILHISCCKGVEEASLCQLMSQTNELKSLSLRDTNLADSAILCFRGSLLETLDVSNTKVSCPALAHIVSKNPGLKSLAARDCKNLLRDESGSGGRESRTFLSDSIEIYSELGKSRKLEELALGWGFSFSSIVTLGAAAGTWKSLIVGLGGSLGQNGVEMLPNICPLLETLILYFQAISDSFIREVAKTMKRLRVLALCYCFGEISSLSLRFSMPSLRILKLERVAPWMTNDDLMILTQNCTNLVDLSLLGCRLLTSESQVSEEGRKASCLTVSHYHLPFLFLEAQGIISSGWPGLVSISLEDCGHVTADGISSLSNCVALQDMLIRHNGSGVGRNFIIQAASKMPMLRQISLDTCDARDGDFDLPGFADRYALSIVTISRCKLKKSTLDVHNLRARKAPIQQESLVLAWDSKKLMRTVVKERI